MIKHKYKIFAIAVCAIFFLLALSSSLDNGILADEIPHIAGGYYYLKTNRYFLNPEHPPLVKDVAGLGQLLIAPALPEITNEESLPENFHRAEYPFVGASFPKALEWQNNQDHFGTMYLFGPENNPDRIAFFARLAVIVVNTLLLFLLFHLLAKVWTERAAFLGLFFFAISQFSIAHGSFVVIDFMSAVLTVIALVTFAIFLKENEKKQKAIKYLLFASLFFALALLSKFSSVVLLPAAFFGGLFFVLLSGKEKWHVRILKYILSFSAIALLAFFFVSLFYAFHTWKMEDAMLIKKIHENYPEEQLPPVGHKILESMVLFCPLSKGLAGYINGMFMVVSRMVVSAQNTYFLGNVFGNEGAGWKYWPVLYATKLSLGLHFFTIFALILTIVNFPFWKKSRFARNDKAKPNPLPLLLIVFIVAYMAVTLRSTFQIGLRHIMPVILAMCLLTGRGVDNFWKKTFLGPSFRMRHLFAIVAIAMLVSVSWSFPYYLEYYNPLGGGTDNGYKIATDSNYDWGGSDVRRLGKWMKENNVSEIYTQMFADVPLKYYLGEGQKGFNLQDGGQLPPSGSYIAVSVFEYMNNMHAWYIPPERRYSILDGHLVARAGKTIFVYKVP